MIGGTCAALLTLREGSACSGACATVASSGSSVPPKTALCFLNHCSSSLRPVVFPSDPQMITPVTPSIDSGLAN